MIKYSTSFASHRINVQPNWQKMESNIKEAISDVVGPLFEWSRLLYHNVPGMSVIGRYIRNSYQNDPIRVVLELILLLFAVKYLMSKKYKPDSKDVALSEKV